MKKFMINDWEKVNKMLVSHRGFRNKNRENRFIDFKYGLEICLKVEFDIRLTQDKKVIIFHDHNFKRIGNSNKRVKNCTWEQIKNIFKNNQKWLPTLFDEFIEKLSSNYKMINVEIKPDYYTKEEYDILLQSLNRLRNKTKAEIIVSSFSKLTLKWISKLNKHFKKGYLIEFLSNLDHNLIKKFDYIHPYVGTICNPKNIDFFKKLNLPMNVWTYKTQSQVDKSKKIYGSLIVGYISDNPEIRI